jgi:hypothetical protein
MRLVPAADTALFSHRPTAVADNLLPAFPLQFDLPYLVEEYWNDDLLLLSMSHNVKIFF